METNLRKLLVEETVPLPMEVEIEEGRITQTIPSIVYVSEPGKTVLAIGDEGENIIATTMVRRFLPPLVQYKYETEAETERAIQDRIAALMGSAVHCHDHPSKMTSRLPLVAPDKLEDYFRELLPLEPGEPIRVMISEDDTKHLELGWASEVFSGALPGTVIAIKGKPGAIVDTPVGTGMFINETRHVIGAWIYEPS